MDAFGRIIKLNKKGFAVVYIALMIVVLVAFVGLAVDLGYMYVAKGQLQNAADAAALAGATQLSDATKVRTEAKKFALANKAAGDDVVITDADIELGNWNAALTPKFSTTRPAPAPINAVRVVARRNVAGATAANQGQVALFFGNVINWGTMGTVAEAIATRPPRPAAGITLCNDSCSFAGQNDVTFYFNEADITRLGLPMTYGAAFTEYSPSRATDFGPNGRIQEFINGSLESPVASDLCGVGIMTNNAPPQQILVKLQDRITSELITTPLGWEVIIPVVTPVTVTATTPPCPPGSQPTEPYEVMQFARIRLKSVSYNPTPAIILDYIECISCANIDEATGIFHSKLVK